MSWILVVEDDEDVSSFLQYVLEGDDFKVHTAATLAEARQRLSLGLPSAIILDRGLPDGVGLDLCRELNKTPEERHLPVLVLSSRKDPEEVREGFAAGADEYIVKPFQFVNVLAQVRALTACA